MQAPSDVGELNLLPDYMDPQHGDTAGFWMEPGEHYRLGVPIVPEPATYVVKVTFIGQRGDDESWSSPSREYLRHVRVVSIDGFVAVPGPKECS